MRNVPSLILKNLVNRTVRRVPVAMDAGLRRSKILSLLGRNQVLNRGPVSLSSFELLVVS